MILDFLAADPMHAEAFLEYRQDSEVTRFNPLAASTLEELRARLANAGSDLRCLAKLVAELSEPPTHDAFFWFLALEGKIVGNVTLQKINRMMLTAEIGYGVFSTARGLGVATASVEQLSRRVFKETPLRKLIAFVHTENKASRRVLEKVGYREEGLLREHYLVNGKPADEIIYGLLRRELV